MTTNPTAAAAPSELNDAVHDGEAASMDLDDRREQRIRTADDQVDDNEYEDDNDDENEEDDDDDDDDDEGEHHDLGELVYSLKIDVEAMKDNFATQFAQLSEQLKTMSNADKQSENIADVTISQLVDQLSTDIKDSRKSVTDRLSSKIDALEETMSTGVERRLLEWKVRMKAKIEDRLQVVDQQVSARLAELESALRDETTSRQALDVEASQRVDQLTTALHASIDASRDEVEREFEDRLTQQNAAVTDEINTRVAELRNAVDTVWRNILARVEEQTGTIAEDCDRRLEDVERRLRKEETRTSPTTWLILAVVGYVALALMVFVATQGRVGRIGRANGGIDSQSNFSGFGSVWFSTASSEVGVDDKQTDPVPDDDAINAVLMRATASNGETEQRRTTEENGSNRTSTADRYTQSTVEHEESRDADTTARDGEDVDSRLKDEESDSIKQNIDETDPEHHDEKSSEAGDADRCSDGQEADDSTPDEEQEEDEECYKEL